VKGEERRKESSRSGKYNKKRIKKNSTVRAAGGTSVKRTAKKKKRAIRATLPNSKQEDQPYQRASTRQGAGDEGEGGGAVQRPVLSFLPCSSVCHATHRGHERKLKKKTLAKYMTHLSAPR
jgi:hypothetical protein